MAPNVTPNLKNQDDLLPYEMSHIPEFLRKRAKSELFEDEDTRINSLKLFRSMLKDEPNLNWQNDELFLLAFLRARKFDVKRAFQLIKTFYIVMGKRDELYNNFDYSDVRRTLDENIIGYLPYRDSEGCVILVIRIQAWNPHVNTLGDLMRALTSGLLHANLSPATQISGFKVIVDFSGFTLKHIPHVSPTYLWLFAEALQNCFPGRFRAIHIVNETVIFSYVWTVLKQLLTKKIKDRFHFHGKNVAKLHKHFSPSVLPAEYGGELPHFDNSDWKKKMEQEAEYIKYVFSHGYEKCKVMSQENTSSQTHL